MGTEGDGADLISYDTRFEHHVVESKRPQDKAPENNTIHNYHCYGIHTHAMLATAAQEKFGYTG